MTSQESEDLVFITAGSLKVKECDTPNDHTLKRDRHEDGGRNFILIICIPLEDCEMLQSKRL